MSASVRVGDVFEDTETGNRLTVWEVDVDLWRRLGSPVVDVLDRGTQRLSTVTVDWLLSSRYRRVTTSDGGTT